MCCAIVVKQVGLQLPKQAQQRKSVHHLPYHTIFRRSIRSVEPHFKTNLYHFSTIGANTLLRTQPPLKGITVLRLLQHARCRVTLLVPYYFTSSPLYAVATSATPAAVVLHPLISSVCRLARPVAALVAVAPEQQAGRRLLFFVLRCPPCQFPHLVASCRHLCKGPPLSSFTLSSLLSITHRILLPCLLPSQSKNNQGGDHVSSNSLILLVDHTIWLRHISTSATSRRCCPSSSFLLCPSLVTSCC